MANKKQINQVRDLIINGLCREEIAKYCANKLKWTLSDSQVGSLIEKANKDIENEAEPDRKQELIKVIHRLNNLYARSIQINDYKTCLAIEKERITLLSLGVATKKTKKSAPLSSDELKLHLRLA